MDAGLSQEWNKACSLPIVPTFDPSPSVGAPHQEPAAFEVLSSRLPVRLFSCLLILLQRSLSYKLLEAEVGV